MQTKNKVGVKNPLMEDITVKYDISGKGQPETYTLKSFEIDFFEPVIAEHLKKHLIDMIIQKRGVNAGSNYWDDRTKIYKEISITP